MTLHRVGNVVHGDCRHVRQHARRFGWLGAAVFGLGLLVAPALAAVADKLPEGVFARIGDQEISFDEYHGYLAQRLRQKYFHGRLIHEEMTRAQKEIAQELIDHCLASQEAVRRGLVAPQSDGETKTPEELAERTAKLKEQLRTQVVVSEADVKGFYAQHPDKFTAPEQVRLSVILLAVPPYAPKEDWQAAHDQAVALRKRIVEAGEAFGEVARSHSKHDSASKGGDLGFVHKGRLAPDVEGVVDQLGLGKVSEPVPLLQGVALFRVEERKSPYLNSFEDVADRARLLWVNERSQAAWQVLIDELRQTTPIAVAEGAL